MNDRTSTPKLRDRLMSEARELSSRETRPFRESLDHTARTRGFDDWKHFESHDTGSKTFMSEMTMTSIMLGRGTSGVGKPAASALLLLIARRTGFMTMVPDAVRRHSIVTAASISAIAAILFGIAFLDVARIQSTGIAGMLGIFTVIATLTATRNVHAASRHPGHRSAPYACAMAIYLLGFAMPFFCLAGTMLISPSMRESLPLMGGLATSLVAGPFWLIATADILLRHEESVR